MAFPNDQKLSALSLSKLLDALVLTNQSSSDSFGRARVSQSIQEMDVKFTADLRPEDFVPVLTATGTVAHEAGESHALLSVAAASDEAWFRSRSVAHYRAGQSLQIIMTGLFGTAEAGITRRMGYFNQSDGVFLQETNGALSFIIRSSIDAVETEVAQASWNKDTFDGTGDAGNPSGLSIDSTKDILLVIDLQYLGIGQIRFGFTFGGKTVWAHWVDYSNQGITPYMLNANLNLSYEIAASAAYAGDGAEMRAFCCTAIREGDAEEPTQNHTAATVLGTNATPGSNAFESVVSVRVKDAYKFFCSLLPVSVAMFTASAQAVAWVVLRQNATDAPAAVTGGAWTAVGPESVSEYSVVEAAVDITKGKRYDQGYVASSNRSRGSVDIGINDSSSTGLDASDDQDVLILAAAGLGAAGAVQASLHFREIR